MFSATQHDFRMQRLSIALLGNQPSFGLDTRHAVDAALQMGAHHNRVCIIYVPSNHTGKGHKNIQNPDFEQPIYAEGTILQSRGQAVALQTDDSPTVILYDSKTHNVVVTHAGRPAMTPPEECATCSFSVLDAAYQRLLGHEKADGHIHAFIIGSICGHCFVHDEPGAEAFVTPFDRYGHDVFTDRSKGALDMVKLITLQLRHRGIPAENIRHDGQCTQENVDLSSRRGGRYKNKNTIIVVRH